MNLQTILYGQFTPPPVAKTRHHRILESHFPPPPEKRLSRKPNEQLQYAEELYKLIEEYPGICLTDATARLNKSRSLIYKVCDILVHQGRIYGVKGKSEYRIGPRTTLYYASEYAC